MRSRLSIAYLSFVFVLLQAVLMAHVAFSAAVPHRTVEMTPVAAEGELAKELGRYGMTAWRTVNRGPKFSCLAYTPPNAGRKPIPLVVYIPGKGEIGPDLLKQFHQRTLFDLVTSQKFQSRHPCHLLALSPPAEATTLAGGGLGCPSRVQQMLRAIVSWMETNAVGPKVDASRIYLVGFSYGGDGVYALANHYPGEFAAAVPISSGCPHPEYVSESSPGNWWHVYNELDFAGCERMFAELNAFKDRVNALGGDFRMGTYPKAGHDAWTAAWREDELWDWMFSKSTAHGASRRRRDGAAAAPVSLAESVCTSSVSGEDTAHGPERAADGLKATAYVAARPFSKGDWWRIDFAAPASGRVKVVLGDSLGNKVPHGAVVEATYDGRTWRRVSFQKGKERICEFSLHNKARALRIGVTGREPVPFAVNSVSLFPGRP